MVDDTPESPATDPPEPQVVEVRPPVRQRIARAALLVWLVLVVVFALANLQWVEFNWIFGETKIVPGSGKRVSGGVPLILLLTGAFASGLVTGMVLVGLRGRRRRKAAKDADA